MYTEAEKDVINEAMAIINNHFKREQCDALAKPQLVKDYLKLRVAGKQRECFGMIYLDTQNRVISDEIISIGTIDKANVYPREVVKSALSKNCNAVIFFHNHPSGIAEPSSADKYITNRCADALALIDVRTLDHIIVGEGEAYSFAEHNLI